MGEHALLFLSMEDVIACGGADCPKGIQDVESALSLYAKGECVLPHKTVMTLNKLGVDSGKGHMNAMPGYIGGSEGVAGIKWVTGFYDNPRAFGIPAITALIVLNDRKTGYPLAIMDGTVVTAVRTAAVSAVAFKYLGREGSATVAIVGAGVQARAHVAALRSVMPNMRVVRVQDANRSAAERLQAEMQPKVDVCVEVVDDARTAIEGADVVITATSGTTPVVQEGWLGEGVFYSCVGGHECDFDAVREFDKILVDDWDAVLHRECQSIALMAMKGLLSDDDIAGSLGQVINGDTPGRQSEDEKIMFTGVGMAIEDLAIAYRIYREAKMRSLGKTIALWQDPEYYKHL